MKNLIVGCGISGATLARLLAERGEKKVTIIDSKNHVAWNVYDYYKFGKFFIKNNLLKDNIDYRTRIILSHIYNGYYNTKKRYLFGLLNVCADDMCKRYSLFGIHICKILYEAFCTKYKIFGIQVYKKINPGFYINSNTFKKQIINDGLLYKHLSKIGRFTYIPNPGNMGDMLIAASTLQFFDKHNLKYQMFSDGVSDTIVYGGGGIWTSDYYRHWKKILPIFKQAKKVIILPSSFYNCDKLLKIIDGRFTIFCRERQSYNYLLKAKTKAKILLDHDMALRTTKDIFSVPIKTGRDEYKLIKRMANFKFRKHMRFMRTDCESVIKNQNTDLDISSLVYGSEYASKNWIYFSAQLMLSIVYNVKSLTTDRLHVGIAGSLMGKDVTMVDNSYKKLSNVYKFSLKKQHNIKIS
ncbi:MAG: polysaccharide pyruvyl transferase family protein [Alphaproteobacteria bacterium]|nr:polysaccharide pyruvyl transferase family protein [Alphaproteobacteria bacterium]